VIGQCLSNKNEMLQYPKTKNFCELNKALVIGFWFPLVFFSFFNNNVIIILLVEAWNWESSGEHGGPVLRGRAGEMRSRLFPWLLHNGWVHAEEHSTVIAIPIKIKSGCD